MKCPHCNKELGIGDEYDLMRSHAWECNSDSGRKAAEAQYKENMSFYRPIYDDE
jgi:hypothetical protein